MSPKFQDNRSERDLFDHIQKADKKIKEKTKFILPQMKNSATLSYENMIFIAIGFVMACVVFFSLGVEKGRKDISRIIRERLTVKIEQPEEPQPEKKNIKIQQEQKTGLYVIQLATFKKLDSAKQAMAYLKNRGFIPSLKKSGDYYQLSVGSFNSQKSAEKLLRELKKIFKDSYLKKN